ncbi:MAG: hypothetical protein Q9167_003138 [Letrouitia subvulpina]
MPRLIRRRPLAERLQSYLNPLNIFLWLSEELESRDWDQWQNRSAMPVAAALNLVFLIARANSGSSSRRLQDDVFSDDEGYGGWLPWFVRLLAAIVVYLLSFFSIGNAAYAFLRQRHYRLFENPVDAKPNTSSAHRVNVDSSPPSSSPLRFLSSILTPDNSGSPTYTDASVKVWELSVWDPNPFALRLFCLFSPGHVLVYWLFLPTTPLDHRPSITLIKTLVFAGLLSLQMAILQLCFSQQSKDISIINKEVLNEYDTKFVHPQTQPVMRDVGIQFSDARTQADSSNSIDTYTPTTIIKKGFHIHPNPNYVKYLDPDRSNQLPTPSGNLPRNAGASFQTPQAVRNLSSPSRYDIKPWQARTKPNIGAPNLDGGNLGVFSHASSPLRKSVSTDFRTIQGRERTLSPEKREGSPLKRHDLAFDRSLAQNPGHKQGFPTSRRESSRC